MIITPEIKPCSGWSDFYEKEGIETPAETSLSNSFQESISRLKFSSSLPIEKARNFTSCFYMCLNDSGTKAFCLYAENSRALPSYYLQLPQIDFDFLLDNYNLI